MSCGATSKWGRWPSSEGTRAAPHAQGAAARASVGSAPRCRCVHLRSDRPASRTTYDRRGRGGVHPLEHGGAIGARLVRAACGGAIRGISSSVSSRLCRVSGRARPESVGRGRAAAQCHRCRWPSARSWREVGSMAGRERSPSARDRRRPERREARTSCVDCQRRSSRLRRRSRVSRSLRWVSRRPARAGLR